MEKLFEKLCISQIREIDELKTKISELQDLIKTKDSREEELNDEIKQMKDKLRDSILKNVDLKHTIVESKESLAKLRDGHEQQQETHNKTLMEERQKYNELANQKDVFEQKMAKEIEDAQLATEKQAQKYEEHITNLKKQCNDLNVSNQTLVGQLQMESDENKALITEHEKRENATTLKHFTKCQELEQRIKQKDKIIQKLWKLSKELETHNKLKKTLDEMIVDMKHKDLKIEHLKQTNIVLHKTCNSGETAIVASTNKRFERQAGRSDGRIGRTKWKAEGNSCTFISQ